MKNATKLEYPDCEPLGSDEAEVQAFRSFLTLVAKLEKEGHARVCATARVGGIRKTCLRECPQWRPSDA